MSRPRSNNTPFWLLLIGIILILLSKNLLTEGMFFDGVTYASISRNMAEGQGTFWNPHYTQTLYPEFRQHPPLSLWLEALVFKTFGDHWMVEKLYSVLTFILTGLLVALIWKRTTNNVRLAWLPLLFWVAMPLVCWCTTNNMHENTMAVFVLLSVYLMILSYQKCNKIWLFLSGIVLLLAFLSKGLTGLFPLVFPILYCAFDPKWKWSQGLIDSMLLVLTIGISSGIVFLVFPESLPYLKDYFSLQVIGGGLYEVTVSSRFFIVFQLISQLVIPLVLLLAFVVSKLSRKGNRMVFEFPPDRSWFFVFLILGLLGVLPIMVSVKQRDFYMLAALPFFALSFSHIALATVKTYQLKIGSVLRKWMTIASCCILLLGIVLNVVHIGKYGRDEELLKDVKLVLTEVAEGEVIAITHDDFSQWQWHAYFMRYGKMSLDDNSLHSYLLLNPSERLENLNLQDRYTKVNLPTTTLQLYKRIP